MFSARDRTLRLVAVAAVAATLLLAACQATSPRAASEEARAKPAGKTVGVTDSAIQPTDHGGDLGRLQRAGCVGSGHSITFVPDRVVNTVEFDKMNDVVAPYALEDVTAADVLVHRLTARGFFEGDPTVAFLDPGGEFDITVRTVMASELLVTAGILDPLIVTDDVETEAQVGALVRQLEGEGVERVVYFDDEPNLLAITRAMVAQGFTHPLAMIASAQPNAVLSSSRYPARQVYAISSVGAYPAAGGAASASASLSDTKAVKACLTAWDGSRLEVDGLRIPTVLEACDMLALLDDALPAAAEPSTASFADGLARLTHFESAYGVTLDFSHGHAGATEVWDLRGDPACHCLKAVGGPYPLAEE
ncbi:hypothetical protein [Actinopolymorpha pittospori]